MITRSLFLTKNIVFLLHGTCIWAVWQGAMEFSWRSENIQIFHRISGLIFPSMECFCKSIWFAFHKPLHKDISIKKKVSNITLIAWWRDLIARSTLISWGFSENLKKCDSYHLVHRKIQGNLVNMYLAISRHQLNKTLLIWGLKIGLTMRQQFDK